MLRVPIPYVVLGPGPTVNTLGTADGKEVIQVTGRETSTSAGQLRLTTVGVQPTVRLRGAMTISFMVFLRLTAVHRDRSATRWMCSGAFIPVRAS